MECNFRKMVRQNGCIVHIDQSAHFWYLGLIAHDDCGIKEDVIHRITP